MFIGEQAQPSTPSQFGRSTDLTNATLSAPPKLGAGLINWVTTGMSREKASPTSALEVNGWRSSLIQLMSPTLGTAFLSAGGGE